MAESEAPKEPQKVEESKIKLSRFQSHPAIAILGFISAIVGLISLPLSFYFYYASKESPQLTYYAHPVKAAIVRTGEASRLSTTFDNNPVETDITAGQVAIWNQGRRVIKREQVLKPVVIFTENNAPILEATIRKSSREVTGLTLNTDELQKGRVTVLWDILEQNDGGVIQLIYAGNTDVQISVDGVVEGQPQIEKLEFTGRIKSPYEQYESAKQEYRGFGLLLYALGLLLLLIAWGTRGVKAKDSEAFGELLKVIQYSIESCDRSIEWENKSIATYEKYIAEFEQRIAESESIAAERGMDVAALVEFPNQVIAGYRKDQQICRESIKEYEKQKKSEVAQKETVIRHKREREKLLNVAAVALVLAALVVLIPAIYWVFIAQPVGPPFGF